MTNKFRVIYVGIGLFPWWFGASGIKKMTFLEVKQKKKKQKNYSKFLGKSRLPVFLDSERDACYNGSSEVRM